EVDVVAAHHVEERVIAGAIEDHLPVASRLDHDRLGGGAAGGQIVGPVPGRSAAAASRWAAGTADLPGTAPVILPHLAIDPGMDQNRVPGLHPRGIRVVVIRPHAVAVVPR